MNTFYLSLFRTQFLRLDRGFFATEVLGVERLLHCAGRPLSLAATCVGLQKWPHPGIWAHWRRSQPKKQYGEVHLGEMQQFKEKLGAGEVLGIKNHTMAHWGRSRSAVG